MVAGSLATFLGSLSEVTQRRVVELAWHLPQLQDTELAVLSKCISSTSLHVHVKQYLIQIVHHKQYVLQILRCCILTCSVEYLCVLPYQNYYIAK